MEKIDKRSQEIIRDQHQEIDQHQTKRKAETEAKAKDNISYWKWSNRHSHAAEKRKLTFYLVFWYATKPVGSDDSKIHVMR